MANRDWDVVVVAHRGMVAGFPENTLAAYRQAITMGFSAIEIDLRATADATSWLCTTTPLTARPAGAARLAS